MKKRDIVPKRAVALEFNKCVSKYSVDEFDEDTISNIQRILDFCANDDWFLPIYQN